MLRCHNLAYENYESGLLKSCQISTSPRPLSAAVALVSQQNPLQILGRAFVCAAQPAVWLCRLSLRPGHPRGIAPFSSPSFPPSAGSSVSDVRPTSLHIGTLDTKVHRANTARRRTEFSARSTAVPTSGGLHHSVARVKLWIVVRTLRPDHHPTCARAHGAFEERRVRKADSCAGIQVLARPHICEAFVVVYTGSSTGESKMFSNTGFGGGTAPGFGSAPSGGFGASQPGGAFGGTPAPSFGSTPSSGFGATQGTGLFGARSAPAFGQPSSSVLGSTPGAGFGSTSGSAFGAQPSSGFGGAASASNGMFGAPSTTGFASASAFGSTGSSLFGASSQPAGFGLSAPAFGGTSSGAFGGGAGSTFGRESFGFSGGGANTPAPGLGLSQSAVGNSGAFGGSGLFGAPSSGAAGSSAPFGGGASAGAFGGLGLGGASTSSTPGGGTVGTRNVRYSVTTVTEGNPQTSAKYSSISMMSQFRGTRSVEELRLEDTGFASSVPQTPATVVAGAGSSGLFGTSSSAAAFSGGSLGAFGSQSQSTFGAAPQSQAAFGAQPQSSLFGSSQPGFGAQSQPLLGSASQPGFGAQPSTGFGAQPAPSSQFSTQSAFGGSAIGQPSAGLGFGGLAQTTPGVPSQSLFGAQSQPAPGGLGGATAAFGTQTQPGFVTSAAPASTFQSQPLGGTSSLSLFGGQSQSLLTGSSWSTPASSNAFANSSALALPGTLQPAQAASSVGFGLAANPPAAAIHPSALPQSLCNLLPTEMPSGVTESVPGFSEYAEAMKVARAAIEDAARSSQVSSNPFGRYEYAYAMLLAQDKARHVWKLHRDLERRQAAQSTPSVTLLTVGTGTAGDGKPHALTLRYPRRLSAEPTLRHIGPVDRPPSRAHPVSSSGRPRCRMRWQVAPIRLAPEATPEPVVEDAAVRKFDRDTPESDCLAVFRQRLTNESKVSSPTPSRQERDSILPADAEDTVEGRAFQAALASHANSISSPQTKFARAAMASRDDDAGTALDDRADSPEHTRKEKTEDTFEPGAEQPRGSAPWRPRNLPVDYDEDDPLDYLPAVSHEGYYLRPTLAELSAFTVTELGAIEGFTIGRKGCGEITWPGAVDVRGLLVDDAVEITSSNVAVYPSRGRAHSLGYRPTRVTLFIGPARDEVVLREMAYSQKTKFIDYDERSGKLCLEITFTDDD